MMCIKGHRTDNSKMYRIFWMMSRSRVKITSVKKYVMKEDKMSISLTGI